MARIARMSGAAILDTSWLLELYRVPGYFEESRTDLVKAETREIVEARYELFVTVPVVFEVASHVVHVRDGRRRRCLGKRLLEDIKGSIERERPWTIAPVDSHILLRSEDVIRLASRFLELSGPNYSFANISIVDLAEELRRPGRTVKIPTFNDQLEPYSD